MTKELQGQYQVKAEIPVSFLRFLETRTDERVLEIVLVYNGVDRYDTVINPTGMRTDPKTVTVDYNHSGVNTGAYLRNVRIENNYKLEDGQVLETALIGDIHIPKDAEMFYFDKQGQKRSNGNLYEAVSKGQVRSVSVEFRPYNGKQSTNTKTGITTFKEWDLLRLALLDVTPGQPYSGIKITRSLINNNQNNIMDINTIKSAVESGKLNKEEILRALGKTEATEGQEEPVLQEEKPEGAKEKTPEEKSEVDQEPKKGSEQKPEKESEVEVKDSESEERAKMEDELRSYVDKKMTGFEARITELERIYKEKEKKRNKEEKDNKEAENLRAIKDSLNNAPEVKDAGVSDKEETQYRLDESMRDQKYGEEAEKREDEIALSSFRRKKGYYNLI